ncbi:Ubiquinone/menaquinone biosynthesis C-methylase UbiE [Pelagirhabdus alkalitolerans]|uniref:Ubiquinone/menaquinone biosynthesis C-methylase UbiE n=1 Tax=Pelagirhabdus alkalitolerans TaxID=1612202 RepID=A0A1G6HTW3_9BACI|nr:class I SAM-dependent methyltransferase [Pelagirhabdus alkalitolerans]SDB97672.1 Ubiquinone/menaquinone biosynthesis C-methylase UbiE [Pelagirhabdus alkalitolerans]
MYQKMAKVYDALMEDAPYEDWVAFTKAMLDKDFESQPKQLLDLGCGTGQITVQLADSFSQVTGVDLSSDMLTEASNRSIEEGKSIQWIHQDMTQLEGLKGFDTVISYCDVINYITEEEKVKSAFSNAYQALNDRGMFLFDVHSLNHVQSNLVGEVFSEVYDDLAYIWFCQAGEREGEMIHDLTFFIQNDKQYDRIDETHQQRTLSVETYVQLLSKVGFSKIEIYKDFETTPINEDDYAYANRLFFVCYK